MMYRVLCSLIAFGAIVFVPMMTLAQSGPLRIEITEGVIEPLPIAVPDLVAETAGSAEMGQQLARVIAADLTGTGLFRELPSSAFISQVNEYQVIIRSA